ncbi:hypothetical protein [Alcanivorax sp. 1008]|uniref:hypothetical protein n=1 Tax=Alcanivorax sp. 1008 TaxID=2816853 RepID=UPI001DFE349B|nr:hypothetical protein [Alcanivorax sp. 1008]MCC1496906.1 hypothetical protein [Alcanivorax sp. 1008]
MIKEQTKVFIETEMPSSLKAILRRHLKMIRSHHFQVRDNTEMGDLVLTGEPGHNDGEYTITLTRSLRGTHETLFQAIYRDEELVGGKSQAEGDWSEAEVEEFIAAISAGGSFKAAPAWEQVHRLTEFRGATTDEEFESGEVELVE